MNESGWQPANSAPQEISREKPVLVLVRSFGGPPTLGAWLLAFGYRTKDAGWLDVETGTDLTPIYWAAIPPFPEYH
jgi:hypothetical protein